jgi:hypothetical protein
VSATETEVPDLLRRFAPTPYSTRVLINSVEIEFHTDDVEIVAKMQPMTGSLACRGSQTLLQARVIRDQNIPPGDSRVTTISAPPLTMLRVGAGTVLVLDCDRREILGFLASSVPAERFIDELLPILLDQLTKAEPVESRERAAKSL